MRRLRVALIAPPWYPVPPHGYGGTELVVYLLAAELRKLGHAVRVFGAQGSCAWVDQLAPGSWGRDLGGPAGRMREAAYLARVFDRIGREHFDVIHDHSGPYSVLLALHVTGFIADSVDGLVEDFKRLDGIDPAQCASLTRRRFSPRRMADGYLSVYAGAQPTDRPTLPIDSTAASPQWP